MPRNAKNASRVARQRQHDARVNSWMAQFDVNKSGRLERPELAALLTHIHPQKEPPQERILDMLITQATEVRTYSMHLPGDPSGAVPFDKIMKVSTRSRPTRSHRPPSTRSAPRVSSRSPSCHH